LELAGTERQGIVISTGFEFRCRVCHSVWQERVLAFELLKFRIRRSRPLTAPIKQEPFLKPEKENPAAQTSPLLLNCRVVFCVKKLVIQSPSGMPCDPGWALSAEIEPMAAHNHHTHHHSEECPLPTLTTPEKSKGFRITSEISFCFHDPLG
jgi:hypothetical protein